MSNPQPPYQPGDVDPKTFGSGGANVAPGQGIPSMGDVLHDLLSRVSTLETDEGKKLIAAGTGVLTAGDSGAIAAPSLDAGSVILVTRKAANASTSLGELTANNRVVGTSFKVQALTPGTPGTPLAADVSSFDWFIYG